MSLLDEPRHKFQVVSKGAVDAKEEIKTLVAQAVATSDMKYAEECQRREETEKEHKEAQMKRDEAQKKRFEEQEQRDKEQVKRLEEQAKRIEEQKKRDEEQTKRMEEQDLKIKALQVDLDERIAQQQLKHQEDLTVVREEQHSVAINHEKELLDLKTKTELHDIKHDMIDRDRAYFTSTKRSMGMITSGATDEFLVRLVPDALPNYYFTPNRADRSERNVSAHSIQIEHACELWRVEGVEPMPGIPTRTDNITFILLFGISPARYHRIRRNSHLMRYYDVNRVLNWHSSLMSNFAMKLFFKIFKAWLTVLDDAEGIGRVEFADEPSRYVRGILEHLHDTYHTDRVAAGAWWGRPDKMTSKVAREARQAVLSLSYLSAEEVKRELSQQVRVTPYLWPSYFIAWYARLKVDSVDIAITKFLLLVKLCNILSRLSLQPKIALPNGNLFKWLISLPPNNNATIQSTGAQTSTELVERL